MNGFLVLDKPSGITSRDAVDHAEEWFPPKTKLGHTGTLDPPATGVLVLCVGAATRLADYVQANTKTYRTSLMFGFSSTTDDAAGELAPVPLAPVSEDQFRGALRAFVGIIDQVPPAYSSVKLDGKRAHALARAGKSPDLSARPVRIDRIDILRYEWPQVDLEIDCGKGTYIRSIARDLGQKLGTAGYVASLRRLRVGCFTVEHAVPWNAMPLQARAMLRPMSEALAHLPTVILTSDEARRFRMGQTIDVDAPPGEESRVTLADGTLVGVGLRTATGAVRPSKNLTPD